MDEEPLKNWEEEGRNFTIKGGKAYTEDGVLVFNIFVRILGKFNKKEIRQHFSQFGAVRMVSIRARKHYTRGFVKFVEAVSAAKALKWRYTYFDEEKNLMLVNAANSWNQPDPLWNLTEDRKHSVISIADIESSNLLSLNEYCLEYLYEDLDLTGQIRLARASPRLHDVFLVYSKTAYKKFNYHTLDFMTLLEIRYFYRSAGIYMETLRICVRPEFKRIYNIFAVFCINLTCLNLEGSEICSQHLHKLLKNLKCLKELNLKNCSLNDDHLLALFQLPYLESLNLKNNFKLTGIYLKDFQQLKVLELYGCTGIKAGPLVNILQSIPGLELLDIRRCILANDIIFGAMVEFCRNLEVLKVSSSINGSSEKVALLPRLKHLEMMCMSGMSFQNSLKQTLNNLAKLKSNNMQSLRIMCKNALTYESIEYISELKELKELCVAYNDTVNDAALRKFHNLTKLEHVVVAGCRNFSKEGLLSIMSSCPQLRHLNIRQCAQLQQNVILDAAKLLNGRIKQSDTPFVLQVWGISAKEKELASIPEYKAAVEESLLQVEFKHKMQKIGADDAESFYEFESLQDNTGCNIA